MYVCSYLMSVNIRVVFSSSFKFDINTTIQCGKFSLIVMEVQFMSQNGIVYVM